MSGGNWKWQQEAVAAAVVAVVEVAGMEVAGSCELMAQGLCAEGRGSSQHEAVEAAVMAAAMGVSVGVAVAGSS